MKKMTSLACIIVILSGILLSGCGGSDSSEADHSGPKRDSTPQVLTPTADGTVVYQNDVAAVDASNTSGLCDGQLQRLLRKGQAADYRT